MYAHRNLKCINITSTDGEVSTYILTLGERLSVGHLIIDSDEAKKGRAVSKLDVQMSKAPYLFKMLISK